MSNCEIIKQCGNTISAQEGDGELYYAVKDISSCLGYSGKDTKRLTISPSNKMTIKFITPSGMKYCFV